MRTALKGIFLVLVLWAAWAATAPAATPAPVKLVLNWKPEAEFGGFYAAEVNGAYAKENLNVEILPGGVGTPAVQMVGAGQAEFGIASADEVILAQDRGADVVALFTVYQTNPQCLMFRADREAKDIPALLGTGILAVQKGLPYFQFLEKKYGPIKAKVVPYLGGVGQLAENPMVTQQGFEFSEPILAQQKKLAVKTFLIADSGFNPYTAVVITRRAYAEKNRETAEAFRRAIAVGWKDYQKDPQAANLVMNKLNPSMDMETLAKSAKAQAHLIEGAETRKTGIGSMKLARWAELGEQLKLLGLIKKTKAPESYLLK